MRAPSGLERLRERLSPPPALIGHSHARAVFEAADREGVRLRGYNFWNAPQPAIDAGRTAFHPEIAKTLSRGLVVSLVGGAAWNMVGLVRHPRPFDFVLPSEPELPIDPEAEVIPYAAARSVMLEATQDYLDILRLVRRTARGRVLHVEAPPPPRDDARVEADIPWSFFPDLTRRVSPSAFRYKCWRLHAGLVGEVCAELGVPVMPPPPAAVDGDGFLRPEFYLDAMHANADYGALVLAQILKAR